MTPTSSKMSLSIERSELPKRLCWCGLLPHAHDSPCLLLAYSVLYRMYPRQNRRCATISFGQGLFRAWAGAHLLLGGVTFLSSPSEIDLPSYNHFFFFCTDGPSCVYRICIRHAIAYTLYVLCLLFLHDLLQFSYPFKAHVERVSTVLS